MTSRHRRYISRNFSRVEYNFCRGTHTGKHTHTPTHTALRRPPGVVKISSCSRSDVYTGAVRLSLDLPKIGVISLALSPGNDSICRIRLLPARRFYRADMAAAPGLRWTDPLRDDCARQDANLSWRVHLCDWRHTSPYVPSRPARIIP